MKKTILLILAVLPIVLVVIIAFAGRILSLYQHIPVERVEFLNDEGQPFGEDEYFIVNMGDKKSLTVKIYPDLASNKKVKYTSLDESICTVDKNGVVTGVHYGTTQIMVKTDDGGKTRMVDVLVTADIPVGVTIVTKGDLNTPQIPMDTLELIEGEIYDLDFIVELPFALDKSVTFTSSDESIFTVDPAGRLVAVAPGTATVTVSTVSGSHSDTCEITVVKGELPLYFDFTDAEYVEMINGVAVLEYADIYLLDYLRARADIDPADVKLAIISGDDKAILDDGIIEFKTPATVILRAYVGDDRNNPTYYVDITIGYRG